MSNGQPPDLLTKMNSVIRRIDLTCKLLAPVFTGFIISFISLRASAIIFSVWNIVSVFMEYWLIASVYNGVPSLSESDQRRNSRVSGGKIAESSSILEESESSINGESEDWRIQAMERLSLIPCFDSWIVYLKQQVALPGIALAFLYFTVLR
jgi:solute carrier family 40 (iron-regulated transporter), member 1